MANPEVVTEPVDVTHVVTDVIPANVEEAGLLWLQAQDVLAAWGLKVIAAIAILVIGRWIAMLVRRVVRRVMERANVESIIIGFVSSIAYITLLAFVVVAALGQLGIQTTSFIAILGAAGLAIGLALQGSLANFAAGFLMIIFRPFKVGDFIEGAGVAGVVREIQIFTTTLKTPDNKTIIIPNAKLSGDNIINYSAEATRRVDMTVGVAYDADLATVKAVLNDIISRDERIHADPAPQVVVAELADSSVNFVVRVWTSKDDYWGVKCDMTETIKNRFDAEGIGIPFPQRDIHIVSGGVAA
ncbi:MAG: mechanosensitive ion channel [Gammaproteobacteria bacterium]|jgi:small conductance mechanosensitive channel